MIAPRRHPLTRLLLAMSAVLVFAPSAPASAHAGVLSTLPADLQELDASPQRLEVAFDETVSMPDDGLRLVDESGASRQLEFRLEPTVSGSVAVVEPPQLADGWYALTWRAISADGHPIDGSARFRVLSAPLQEPAEDPGSPPLLGPVQLVQSFPRQAVELRYPPRESRLVFDRPVQVSDLTAFLVFDADGSSQQLQRLSSGTSSEVLLRLPVLQPGSYRLGWELGEGPEGSVRFSVAESITAPGGGNHRHSTDDLYLESFSSWLPRALLLAVAGLLLALWSLARDRTGGEASVLEVLGPRALSAAAALVGLFGVGVSVVEGLVRFHDHPLEGVLSFDSVWVYVAVVIIGISMAVSGRSGAAVPAAALSIMALVWSVGPFMQFRYGPLVPLTGGLAYLSLTLFFLFLGRSLLSGSGRGPVLASLLGLIASSSLLLAATAQTFDLLGNFAWEWSVRWRVILLTSALAAVWYVAGPRARGLTRLAAVLLAMLALLGVWMPPPAPGV